MRIRALIALPLLFTVSCVSAQVGPPGSVGDSSLKRLETEESSTSQSGRSRQSAGSQMNELLTGIFSDNAFYGRFAGELVVSEAAGQGVPPEAERSADQPAGASTDAASAAESSAAERRELELSVPSGLESVIRNNDVIGYYGHPNSEYMGILGEHPIPEMAQQLADLAAEYDEINGERGTVPAFHVIYGTIYAEGDVGIIDRDRLMEYIRYARENDIVVILDHQLGQSDAEEAVRGMLPYLQYENVHLAIDPEWSTDRPNQEIGSVTADEVNRAQSAIQDYLVEHEIQRQVLFVVHQFNWVMIQNRHQVRSDFSRVAVIHNMDGFGPPQDKYKTWEFVSGTQSMPLKGFKLFYPKSWRAGGYDDPILEPEEVLALEPRPVYIQYQ